MRGIGSFIKAVAVQLAVSSGFIALDESVRVIVRQKLQERADAKKRVSSK